METARVSWSISADVECPHCGDYNDFMEMDEWHVYTQPCENKDKFFRPVEWTCRGCGKDFIINGSDY